MRAHLEAALRLIGRPANDYGFVDLGQLAADDPRTGYPTPTILYRGADIFGLSVPTPPWPAPT